MTAGTERWSWELLDGAGRVLDRAHDTADGPAPVFSNRFDAESWLGALWRDLAGRGAATARLRQSVGGAGQPVTEVLLDDSLLT